MRETHKVLVMVDSWNISHWLGERVGVLDEGGMHAREEGKVGILWQVSSEVRMC